MQVTFDIPTEHTPRLIAAFNGVYNMPMEEDGEGELVPLYTEAAWAKECIRLYMKKTVVRWEKAEAARIAKLEVVVDDSIVT